jgi:UDP-N-acetylglucosamine transferase subunit ALG13
MIFASLGTSTYSFDRFVEIVDSIAEKYDGEVYLQHGYNSPGRQVTANIDFLPHEEYLSYLTDCKYFIAHGGIGCALDAKRLNKKFLMIPRSHTLGEHCDGHQLELSYKLKDRDSCELIFPEDNYSHFNIEGMKAFSNHCNAEDELVESILRVIRSHIEKGV